MRRLSRVNRCCVAILLAIAAPAVCLAAGPSMPAIFSDHMVLQREKPIPIWGRAEANENVTVTLAKGKETPVAKAGTQADASGKWMVRLPALSAGGPYTLQIKAKKAFKFENVMLGEVWVCSGQSNMYWVVSRSKDADKEIAAANYPDIRLFSVNLRTAPMPTEEVNGGPWQTCTPETIKDFSAVAYFFGRELHGELKVPIGLIKTAWGGTAIEPWTPPVGFASVPSTQRYFDQVQEADRDYIKSLADHLDKRAEWAHAAGQVKLDEGDKLPPAPMLPEHTFANGGNRMPTVIYNAMVDAMVPYAIAGAIWYQGENNCSRGDGLAYADKMKALIQGWRAMWDQGEFPFYYVQLAPFKYTLHNPAIRTDQMPLIWQAQLNALAIPNTGMAVTTDVGDWRDIHPADKLTVGRRLALWALTRTYGRDDVVCSGPLYRSLAIEDGKVRVTFDHVGGGLMARDGQPLNWFEVAAADGEFVAARAEIDGDVVVVWSDDVPEPAAVRYAWHMLPEPIPNLVNKAGLPASPFSTRP